MKRKRDDQRRKARRVLAVRVSETGFERIRIRAQQAEVSVSEMVRTMLAVAEQAMGDPK